MSQHISSSGVDPATGRLDVVLCEPYFTGSHRAWATGLAAHSRHDVALVTHHGGFWKWRMQGAAATLAVEIRGVVASRGRPDVLLVSDMVNVPALLGSARDALAGVPVVLYLHENQLTYPLPEGVASDDTYAMVNWLSLLSADRVVFNSEFHRAELLGALPAFLGKFPDHRHTHLVPEVAAKATVLGVGIDLRRFRVTARSERPPLILWNHRWEYDKHLGAFFAALERLDDEGIEFRLAVAGEQYQTVPEDFERARERFATQLVHFGTASAEQYPGLLERADIVVSTARHEFFGVAIAEAIAAGACPILPDRLSYPELVPAPRDRYLYRTQDELVGRLRWAVTDHDGRWRAAETAHQHIRQFGWERLAPRYDALLAEAATLTLA
ncbi:MAG: DUF3524 domain-containing protein [Myxococcales bacterium]|nr:DUF3524 domain-containing protein [Myxococcales bacterium]